MDEFVNLKGRLWQLPDGTRVRVVSVEGNPRRALVIRIDGSRVGTSAICLVSKLRPWESETVLEDHTDSAAS